MMAAAEEAESISIALMKSAGSARTFPTAKMAFSRIVDFPW